MTAAATSGAANDAANGGGGRAAQGGRLAATPLAGAAERIRASAQWLLGAFAAVGALLAAGLQLADIGDLDIGRDRLRFAMVAVGLAVVVLGVVLAIGAAASVQTSSHVSLAWLQRHHDSEAFHAVRDDHALTQGYTLSDLGVAIERATTMARGTYREILALGNPGDDQTKQASARALNDRYTAEIAQLDSLRAIRSDILDVASYTRVRAAFDGARRRMAAGAVLVAAGLAAFAWGAHPPERRSIDGGEILPKTPSEVTVVLGASGRTAFGEQVRRTDDCDLTTLAAIAFGVGPDGYDVVTVGTDACEIVRLTVAPDHGHVIPRVTPSPSPAPGEP